MMSLLYAREARAATNNYKNHDSCPFVCSPLCTHTSMSLTRDLIMATDGRYILRRWHSRRAHKRCIHRQQTTKQNKGCIRKSTGSEARGCVGSGVDGAECRRPRPVYALPRRSRAQDQVLAQECSVWESRPLLCVSRRDFQHTFKHGVNYTTEQHVVNLFLLSVDL